MSARRRVYQVGERIKELVARNILFAADPRLNLVTVTAVMVSPDLRQAKVYWVVSVPPGEDRSERIEQAQEALDGSAGLFRRMLSKELGIRFVPALKFFYDDTLDTVEQVEQLMQRIRPANPEPEDQSFEDEGSAEDAGADLEDGDEESERSR